MKRKKLFFCALLLFLATLVLLGQTEYAQKHWMIMGVGIAPFILFFVLSPQRKNSDFLDFRSSLHWLALAVYMFHQFEEHGIDCYGQLYAFVPSFNQQFASSLGCADTTSCPLNPEMTFYINTLLIWWSFMIAIYKERSSAILGSFSVGLIVINGLLHTIPALVHGAYNPGLLTSLVLFFPFSFFYYKSCFKNRAITKPIFVLSLLYGILSHVFLISMVLLFNSYHTIPSILFPLAFILFALLPIWIDSFFHTRPNEV